MLNCRRASELVSLAEDRKLGWVDRWRLRAHLGVCEGCRQFKAQMDFLREAIRRHPALREDTKES
ncbi:MAG TPA: zf-HC2 domain-containing protein [Burkholderiales bacterium]|nr:zf-HC2 domain-containing protein [Burkholderiales bacterium]